ncbi:hypothetical protein OPU39_19015, partial [Acinetobacter nosocomialis]|nr:hypothetical protein [Acinetobacter nosocomialis]
MNHQLFRQHLYQLQFYLYSHYGGIIGGGTSPISPVVDAVQSGIDVLQGVESLKTSIINTGINTVADTVVGVL